MKMFLFLFLLAPLQAFAYQAYWTDALVRRFGDGGKLYNQEIARVGASYSKDNKGIWGKFDRIENNAFGHAYAGDIGGVYRYGSYSTTAGIGYGSDYHLRSNRLYILEQRLYTFNERLTPMIGYAREEYLGTPQSYYDFYRLGLTGFATSRFLISGQIQKIENTFSDTDYRKKGVGAQLMFLYQQPKWMGQAGIIHNCLGQTASCGGSKDIYEEWLSMGQWSFKPGWYLRGSFSYIKQSSRFIAPFSGQVLNSVAIASQLYSLGLMCTLP
ncbi:MAG: hypothetical protein ACOYL6_03355 [Bacteriovoracaceae bacterium]